jgi:glyoxylase-like metal-dependent hydrolase (beta-lactamase superfamily II)
MRKSIFVPTAEKAETIELPVSSALLRHGQANVLFDTGCHPSVPENPEARWGGLARLITPIMQPGEHVLTGLTGLGLKPDDIDIVINSHLHPDHCGCNAFFRKATFMVHFDELDAARAPNSEAAGYLAADWDQPMPVDERHVPAGRRHRKPALDARHRRHPPQHLEWRRAFEIAGRSPPH